MKASWGEGGVIIRKAHPEALSTQYSVLDLPDISILRRIVSSSLGRVGWEEQ